MGCERKSVGRAEVPLGTYAKGRTWVVLKRDGGFVLDYFSGEHGGGGKQAPIEKEEAEGLATGEATVDEILIAHGAS